MVYRILFYIVKLMHGGLFRRIYVNGLENIDPSKTYLITSNHPNGFVEPLIMACNFPIDLYFMVRGDLFENPFMNWFLRSTHQIPIFRFVDGFSKMKENNNSLNEATQVLNEGKTILIFAEGSTIASLQCRPIQKGAAKIAFKAFDDYPDKDIHILPVGINMSDWENPGGEVILNVGESYSARPFYDDEEEKVKGIRELTKVIGQHMQKHIFHVNEKEDEIYVTKFWQLLSTQDKESKRLLTDRPKYDLIDKVVERVNSNNEKVKQKIESLYELAFKSNNNRRLMGVKSPLGALFLLLGIPGMLFYAIPIFSGYRMRDTKVTRVAFAGPILAVTTFILIVIFHLILFFIIFFANGLLTALVITAGLLFSGFCYLLFWENRYKVNKLKLGVEFYNELDALIKSL
jgi:1-acyl-sn-glycerol-3-phosphate acyltransferase